MATFAPGFRVAYERDGSIVYRYRWDGQPENPHPDTWWTINDESIDGIEVGNAPSGEVDSGGVLAVVLREAITLAGVFIAGEYEIDQSAWYGVAIEISSDSTNGLDGTWTTVVDYADRTAHRSALGYRTEFEPFAQPNVKAVRVRYYQDIGTGTVVDPNESPYHYEVYAFHIYGTSQLSYLRFWHPTLNQAIPLDQLDWGDIYAGETLTQQFRIRNMRVETAKSVTVSTLTYTGPENSAYHEFSLDGVTWMPELNLGDLAPLTASPIIYVKYSVPEDATLREYATQVSAIPLGWV